MSGLANTAISAKLFGVFAVLVLLTAGVGAINLGELSVLSETVGNTARTYCVIMGSQHMLPAMVDQETGLRGYLLAAKEAFLGPYRGGQQAFDAAAPDTRA